MTILSSKLRRREMDRGERGGRRGGIEKIEDEGPGGVDIFLNASIFVSIFCGVDAVPSIFVFASCPPFDLHLHQPRSPLYSALLKTPPLLQ
jgi:hypothetical protein